MPLIRLLELPLNLLKDAPVPIAYHLLKLAPRVIVALYDRILTLNMLGRHKETRQGIDEYVSLDGQSIWAERLRNLRVSILNK